MCQKVFPTYVAHRHLRGRIHGVDAIDRRILAELQGNARLTVTDLAERVQLSLSPCHRRLRALERSGAISGYRARLNPQVLGLGFEALVFATMNTSDGDILTAFEQQVIESRNVVTALRLFGEPDYLLRVVATDLGEFQQLYDTELGKLPGVQRLTTSLVMKTVAEGKPLPVP
jgi:DNA-binding Lrp family transcriptional regulator